MIDLENLAVDVRKFVALGMRARTIESLQKSERALFVFRMALVEHVRDGTAQQHLGFPGVNDFKAWIETRFQGVLAQQAGAEGVDGGDLRGLKRIPVGGVTLLHQAHEHVRGGLLGEGDRKNLVGPEALLRDQPAKALDQHRGLARTRTGHDANVAHAPAFDGLTLRFCQIHTAISVRGRLTTAPGRCPGSRRNCGRSCDRQDRL